MAKLFFGRPKIPDENPWWQLERRAFVAVARMTDRWLSYVAFSPDGAHLATTGESGKVCLTIREAGRKFFSLADWNQRSGSLCRIWRIFWSPESVRQFCGHNG